MYASLNAGQTSRAGGATVWPQVLTGPEPLPRPPPAPASAAALFGTGNAVRIDSFPVAVVPDEAAAVGVGRRAIPGLGGSRTAATSRGTFETKAKRHARLEDAT